jgi:hypothetical protein
MVTHLTPFLLILLPSPTALYGGLPFTFLEL